jgi:hypothetical protein
MKVRTRRSVAQRRARTVAVAGAAVAAGAVLGMALTAGTATAVEPRPGAPLAEPRNAAAGETRAATTKPHPAGPVAPAPAPHGNPTAPRLGMTPAPPAP